jgi:GNAT superfamily N-acetyltransferase
MTTSSPIRVAGADEVEAVGALLADAFDEPVTRWLVPDEGARPPVMSRFFALVAQDAMKAGTVYVSGDYAAAALWFDETAPRPEPEGPDLRYVEVFGRYADRWDTLAALMTANHPGFAPHHYLMLVGVHSTLQGRGLGSALLEEHHRRLAEAGLPAYLEATSQDSRRLYLRHGYQNLGRPLQIPDGPPMWPMWRPPSGVGPMPG